MADVDAQVLGHSASSYNLTSSTQQAMINALAANQAVTIGTYASNNSADTLPGGLYGSHAYAVTRLQRLHGSLHPLQPLGLRPAGQLSWSQLESTCSMRLSWPPPRDRWRFPANLHAPVVAAVSNDSATATNLAADYAAWSTVPANETRSTSNPAQPEVTSGNRQATIFSDRSARPDSTAQKVRQAGGRWGRCGAGQRQSWAGSSWPRQAIIINLE